MPAPYGDSVDQLIDVSDSESIMSSKIIDFRSQINQQISACRWALTFARTPSDVSQAKGAIDVLAAMLVRQLKKDKKYIRAMNVIVRDHNERLGKLSKKKLDANLSYFQKEFLIKKLEQIVDCATRKGFTYIEEVTEKIEVRGKKGVRLELSDKEKEDLKALSANTDILAQEEGIEEVENEVLPPVDPDLETEEDGKADTERTD